ncbi:hypothetical protein [Turicibacter sanguinis]|uniref:hypothetical protein n=1 Tax=Turicibacter sanguinis TaxID=154288 RepID=UPI0012BCAF44|nr:hypothetical protein [Turicibacter sanguinis]MCU7195563.1 hypothetical protein [Turicibacter sanguinis]MDB8439106.1 hypothetical protein [Turicibacter sanguinis]MTO25268.1 hypothetical protein [Turicibacter sanguinis]MTO28158.1 hypothetical protein [Turicibacter sanguinis]MTO91098.1 hypothetical protein [Turicibacter sanguinis]
MNYDILDFESCVPKPLLMFYLKQLKIETDKRSIESIYNALTEFSPQLVDKVYNNYRYAGITAVNIFESEVLCNRVNKEDFIAFLKGTVGQTEIFGVEFKPSLCEQPQINLIEDRGNSILIEFVMLGKPRKVRDGYEMRTLRSIEFEVAIIHFEEDGQVLLELRCPYNKRKKYLETFESYFKLILNNQTLEFEWDPITKVTNEEAEEIARRLSAGLVEAEHKDDGIYDKHTVTASPTVKDLRKQQVYIEDFKNKMLLSQVLTIDYIEKTDYGEYKTEVKFKINLNTGFQFVSKSNEDVVEHVMKVFREVKYGINQE